MFSLNTPRSVIACSGCSSDSSRDHEEEESGSRSRVIQEFNFIDRVLLWWKALVGIGIHRHFLNLKGFKPNLTSRA